MDQQSKGGGRVAVVDGRRTPFCRSGTHFNDLTAYQLGCLAVSGLLHKSRIDPKGIDLLVMGTVVGEVKTSNLGREVVLGTGLPVSIPSFTVTMACVSSLQSFLNCARAIETGAAEVAIAAGAETLSDVPIRFRRPLRKRLIAAQKARGIWDYFKLARGLHLADLLPEPVSIAEFSTGEVMGENCERLTKRLGISREEQDELALASHLRAAWATEKGLLAGQIEPAFVPPDFLPIDRDNGFRGDSTLEKMAKLKPAFDRRFGTVTAANSSFLTDGAAAVLLMSERAAERLGYQPLAYLKSSQVVAMDPQEELLLGPALAMPKALESAGLELPDVEVIELHEAFAGQVLSVLKVLEDAGFCRERLGRDRPVGRVDRDRLNAWGGSLAVGHPFGATGARLIMTCCLRMKHDQARHGLVSACAAGGTGIALVFEAA